MVTALDQQLIEAAAEEQGLSEELVFLLWSIRNVLGVDDLEAYEFAFESPRTAAGLRFDGAFLTAPEDAERESGILNLIEVKTSNTSS